VSALSREEGVEPVRTFCGQEGGPIFRGRSLWTALISVIQHNSLEVIKFSLHFLSSLIRGRSLWTALISVIQHSSLEVIKFSLRFLSSLIISLHLDNMMMMVF